MKQERRKKRLFSNSLFFFFYRFRRLEDSLLASEGRDVPARQHPSIMANTGGAEEAGGEKEATAREERGIDNAGADGCRSSAPAVASVAAAAASAAASASAGAVPAVAPAASSATPTTSPSSFLSWCRSSGIRVHRSLRCAAVAVGGRGVVSVESSAIEAGTALVRVPRKWVFSLGAALAEGDGAFRAAVEAEEQQRRAGRSRSASPLLPPEALLACSLLLEAWKVAQRGREAGAGEAGEGEGAALSSPPPPSRWERYLSSLPGSYPLPMMLERDAVSALFFGIPAAAAAAARAGDEAAGAVAEAAAALVAAAASRGCSEGGDGGGAVASAAAASAFSFARERFAWARATVRSRAMFLSDDDDRASSEGASASGSPLPLPPSFASAGALLPFGDLFNHAHAPDPEEPDTGGSCGSCNGWHSAPGVCCRESEGGGGKEEGAFDAAAAAEEEEAGPRPDSPRPPPSNSWGDGAFDRAASEFVVSARRSYGKVAGEEKGGENGEGEKEGERGEEGAKSKEVQIFLTYSSGGADADNLSTFVNYGFVDPDNPHDRAPLSLEAWRRVAEASARTLLEEARRRGRRDTANNDASPPLALLRWRAEALKLLLPSSSREQEQQQQQQQPPLLLLEADSWCHSLSGAPGWKLLSALRWAFLATEPPPLRSSFSSSSSARSSRLSPLSSRRAAVASGGSPGPAVDAAAFAALAAAALAARELARPGDEEQERILGRAEDEAAPAGAGGGGKEEEGPVFSVSDGILAAACWRRAWVAATERVVKHASRVAEAAAAATREKTIK